MEESSRGERSENKRMGRTEVEDEESGTQEDEKKERKEAGG